MYLSRLVLTISDKLHLRLYGEYDIHKLVYSMFANSDGREFLYYVDYSSIGHTTVLIQSPEMPSAPKFGKLEAKLIPPPFYGFDRYRFRIRISPVKRHNRKVISVMHRAEDIIPWLYELGLKHGIYFDPASMEKEGDGTMHMKKNGCVITISYADITGVLEVKDRELFLNAVEHGIGRAKGFGQGMLLLKPIKEDKI